MIVFHDVSWSNFLSTGDTPTRILLDKSPTTLIVGHNGSGKSTLLDALSFALFGKPHRNVNKKMLINTVNKKATLTEVNFSVSSHKFKIIRGFRPNRFEIYQNGILLNQESTTKDYQKYLETNILKLNHKSFHQIVVLGSSSFIPFMQLPTGSRRNIIEDLLDISIFSKMNQLLKEELALSKYKMRSTSHQLDLTKNSLNLQRDYVASLNAMSKEYSEAEERAIVEIEKEISELTEVGIKLEAEIDAGKVFYERRTALMHSEKALNKQRADLQALLKTLVTQSKFFNNNDTCPTCEQDLDADVKHSKSCEINSEAATYIEKKTEIDSSLDSLFKTLEEVTDGITKIEEANSKLRTTFAIINSKQKEIASKRANISNKEVSDTSEAISKLDELNATRDDLFQLLSDYSDEKNYLDVSAEMLKDTGIKTKIIKEYLPVMNQLVNQYLQIMDFFVKFELDENFSETIKSRYRDTFNYFSFSEGEKMKIDLALLFTWRAIAKMKNSTSTNLLILDETFDSSLDNDGIDNLLKIIYSLEENNNIFIISHKGDVLEGKFRSKIEFIKDKNFSRIVV